MIAEVADVAAAHAAEEQGAEALWLRRPVEGVREATSLPLLWRGSGRPREAAAAGADACLLVVEQLGDGEGTLEEAQREAIELGLECVVEVRDEDELAVALERLDPEVVLLSSRSADQEERALDSVLELLPDVPAGKLAIADVPVNGRDDVLALERAGMDAVIVGAVDVAELVGAGTPEV